MDQFDYTNNIQFHEYYSFDDWFKYCCEQNTSMGVNILHLNIRSIKKHWDNLMLEISNHSDNLDILLLSEISCNDNEAKSFNINNWSSVNICRESGKGGGLIMFYNSSKFNFTKHQMQ